MFEGPHASLHARGHNFIHAQLILHETEQNIIQRVIRRQAVFSFWSGRNSALGGFSIMVSGITTPAGPMPVSGTVRCASAPV
ncbi:MAG: hypothetical protein CM15mP21_1740 [Hyphomicrobiales bacterium]|nr:MAG: hypothetical protein CM15mP21_1740 [Hyphomicrobiales bacterium]